MTLGLFEKRIEGDDWLLELARLRFQQARMGTEVHAGTPDHLEWLLQFKPWPEAPVTLHLPRHFDLCQSRPQILELATRAAGRVQGFVLHDHPDLANRTEDYISAARELDASLRSIHDRPMVFLEYAVGLEPAVFAQFFESIRDLARISACLDTGHLGIWQTRHAYAQRHPDNDICALKTRPPHLQAVMPDVAAAVQSALPFVLSLTDRLSKLGKPLHFHLHDGHPLSTSSPYGVSDHLGFLETIPLPFEYGGSNRAPLMFGPQGLSAIVSRAAAGPGLASFTLEIHPTGERLSLGDADSFFGHWRDKTNAEKMNHWLSVLCENHLLLNQALAASQLNASPLHTFQGPYGSN